MWTYLFILLGVSALVLVFIRRFVLVLKQAKVCKDDTKKTDKADKRKLSPEKLSRSDLSQLEALCEKAKMMIKSGKDDEAIKHFVQALTINDTHAETQYELAMLYMNKQMYSAAAALFKQLSEANRNPVHFSHLGFALFQQNDFEGAKDAYQEAVSLDPSRPQRFISLAQVYRSLGSFLPAVIAVNKAVELDENPDFLFLLADLNFEMGKKDEAGEILQKVLELDPKNIEAKSFLKRLETPPQEEEELS